MILQDKHTKKKYLCAIEPAFRRVGLMFIMSSATILELLESYEDESLFQAFFVVDCLTKHTRCHLAVIAQPNLWAGQIKRQKVVHGLTSHSK